MALLDEVKNYLDITWQDQDTETKLTGIVERGKKYIDKISGKEQDYDQNDLAKSLLLDYCLYARNQALAEFAHDYQHELMQLQIRADIERWQDANEDSEEDTPDVQ